MLCEFLRGDTGKLTFFLFQRVAPEGYRVKEIWGLTQVTQLSSELEQVSWNNHYLAGASELVQQIPRAIPKITSKHNLTQHANFICYLQTVYDLHMNLHMKNGNYKLLFHTHNLLLCIDNIYYKQITFATYKYQTYQVQINIQTTNYICCLHITCDLDSNLVLYIQYTYIRFGKYCCLRGDHDWAP